MNRGKFKLKHQTPYGEVILISFFNFHKATDDQKFGNHVFTKDGEHRCICNGCGPAGYGPLVPDSILGVPISICGHNHNWGYQFGENREDRMLMDETFGDNMDRCIRAKYNYDMAKCKKRKWFKRFHHWNAKRRYHLRLAIAEKVFEKAVKVFGKSSFWDKDICDFKWEAL